MHTIIGGRSAIDLSHLRLGEGSGQAEQFLLRYGYDLDNPIHVQEVERLRVEALGFVRGVLLPGIDGLTVPDELDTLPIVDLLRLAAGESAVGAAPTHALPLRMAWACTVLRVMHTMSHAYNFFQNNYYHAIRESILNRFVDQVCTKEDGSLYLRGPNLDVPLVRFEVKETKPIRSVVLKLLQKQENVAYDLFDHIGVRMIVERPVDALFAVRALREEHTIMYSNVKPTRSRNTLLDLKAYDEHVRNTLLRYQSSEISEQQAAELIQAFECRPAGTEQLEWNPYSSDKYRSVQFTCRQMIRMANPLYTRLVAASEIARKHLAGAPLDEMLASLSTVGVEPEIQFFFPYEVQVMDIASYQQATVGRASYGEYKQRQVAAVRKRVMARVLELSGHGHLLQEDGPARSGKGGAFQPVALKRAFSQTGILPMSSVEELRRRVEEASGSDGP